MAEKPLKLRIGFSFLVFNALLFMFRDSRLICGFYAACAIHEFGHMAAVRLTGGRIHAIELSCFGIRMTADPPADLASGAAVLLSGPAANLAVWGLLTLLGIGCRTADLCLAEGLFNLLPYSCLDGGAVLDILAEGSIHERMYNRIFIILRVGTALTITLLSICAFR